MKFVGGRLCLDFTNTVGGRSDVVLRDKLRAYGDLLRFARLSGSLPAAGARRLAHAARSHPARAAAAFRRALELREALFRIFRASIDHGNMDRRRPAARDLETLATELSTARRHERLALAGGIYLWTWDDEAALDRVLWPVARSAGELLTSHELGKLRLCAGEECGWLFLDTSRNHSRRWCDMKDCGNRDKVRRFRRKQVPPRRA